MKKFLMISLSVLSLSACDTMQNITMPDMSSLNPFGGQTSAKATMDTPQTSAPTPQSSSAMDIEMAEMQKLMGNTPRFDMAPKAEEPKFEHPVTQTTQTSDEISTNMKTAHVDENAFVPTTKPSYALPPKTQAEIPSVEKTIKTAVPTPSATNNTDTKIDTPLVEPEAPVAIAQQAKRPAPQQIKEKDIAPLAAIAPTPTTTSDIAIFNEQDLKLSSAKGCPNIQILPAGRSITYFENELSGYMVARAVINEIRGGCEIVKGGLEIDLDIFMDGKIADKGRFEGNQDMEAFMTFPYFVAVSNPQGLPVDKKILATAMRFKPIVNDLKHAEKITQFIPMDDTNNAANYKILVGFQLNRKQLEYNRAHKVHKANNGRVSPDTMPAARRSTNPLTN